MKFDQLDISAGDAQVLEICASRITQPMPPRIGRNKQFFGPDQISYPAAFVCFFDSLPISFKLALQLFGLIFNYRSIRHESEDCVRSSRNWSIEFPPGKNRDASGADRLLDDFLRTLDPLA